MTYAAWWFPVLTGVVVGWLVRSALARWRVDEWRRETWAEARERAVVWSDE